MVPPGEQPDGYSFPDYMYRFLFKKTSGHITGKYGNLTGADDTVITIGTRGDGYTMKCTYEDFGSEYFEWNGTFKNLPKMLSLVPTEKKSEKFISAEPMPQPLQPTLRKRTVTRLTVMS